MDLVIAGVGCLVLGVVLLFTSPHIVFRFPFLIGAGLIAGGIRSMRYRRETARMMEAIRRSNDGTDDTRR